MSSRYCGSLHTQCNTGRTAESELQSDTVNCVTAVSIPGQVHLKSSFVVEKHQQIKLESSFIRVSTFIGALTLIHSLTLHKLSLI